MQMFGDTSALDYNTPTPHSQACEQQNDGQTL